MNWKLCTDILGGISIVPSHVVEFWRISKPYSVRVIGKMIGS
jgi:hypothetical protein